MSAEALGLFAAGLLAAWLRATAPILLAALGGLVSERAGVINVGLEGLMLVAAFFGVIGSAYAPHWWPGAAIWVYPLTGAVLGLLASLVLALVLAVVHLELGADLIVAGIGINLLAAGITVFSMVAITGDRGSTAGLASWVLPSIHVPGLVHWPLADAVLNGDGGHGHHVLVYGAFFAVAGVAWLLWRTRFGLRLRAVGENLDAARSAGIAVRRLQYAALALSGVLAGLGGPLPEHGLPDPVPGRHDRRSWLLGAGCGAAGRAPTARHARGVAAFRRRFGRRCAIGLAEHSDPARLHDSAARNRVGDGGLQPPPRTQTTAGADYRRRAARSGRDPFSSNLISSNLMP